MPQTDAFAAGLGSPPLILCHEVGCALGGGLHWPQFWGRMVWSTAAASSSLDEHVAVTESHRDLGLFVAAGTFVFY